jgi:hypothetical protein
MGEGFRPSGAAWCRCKGAEEISLQAGSLSYQGIDLGVGGNITVPCPWCKPSAYWNRPWSEPLFKALDGLPDWAFRRKA